MGNPGKQQEKEGPPVQSSPRASPGSNGNGGGGGAAAPPLTPKIIPRSESNPYPTTFVQADTSSFKQVVQMLTGSADTAAKRHQAAAAEAPAPPITRSPTIPQAKTGPKRPAFKLYERRHSSFNSLRINPLGPELLGVAAAGFSPRQQQQPEVLSPSVLDFPSLTLSPVTPLIRDPFTRPAPPHPSSPAGMLAEERGIAEKGFYLHPSPWGADPPKLLPLFPVTSPRGSSASPSSRTASP